MPIYEYQCQSCGYLFDKMQKITDAPLTLCPECKQDALSKLVSASRFKLTGTGWYETDFKNKGKPGQADSANDKKESQKSQETGESKAGDTGQQESKKAE